MSERKLEHVKLLLAQGKYAKARAIVATSNHPSRNQWLAHIDRRIARHKQQRWTRLSRFIGITAAAVSVVLMAFVVIYVSTLSERKSQPLVPPTLHVLPSHVITVMNQMPPRMTVLTGTGQVDAVGTDAPLPEPTQTQQPYLQIVDVPLDHPITADQTLRLTRFAFEKTPAGINSVILDIENVSNINQSGVAWYLLSLPDSEQPWVSPAYSSSEQPIENLAAGEDVTLIFDGVPPSFATGLYSLSVWVHRVDAVSGARTHQDGMGYTEPLAFAPPLAMEMSGVAVTSVGGQSTIVLTLSVQNNSADQAELALSFTLGSTTEQTSAANIYEEPRQLLRLNPRESYSQHYSVALPLDGGNYHLTAWLFRREDGEFRPVAGIPYEEFIVVP